MSAHLIFCYGPQRDAARHWMYEVGAPVSSRNPVCVYDADQLRGVEHINFLDIVGHMKAIPESILRVLRDRGAVILKIDDTWSRERRIIAEHHPVRENA